MFQNVFVVCFQNHLFKVDFQSVFYFKIDFHIGLFQHCFLLKKQNDFFQSGFFFKGRFLFSKLICHIRFILKNKTQITISSAARAAPCPEAETQKSSIIFFGITILTWARGHRRRGRRRCSRRRGGCCGRRSRRGPHFIVVVAVVVAVVIS